MGVINSFRRLKWGIVRLCKSNSSWDMTKYMKKENVKNPPFCKKTTKYGYGTHYQNVWSSEGKNSQGQWIWAKKPKKNQIFVIYVI